MKALFCTDGSDVSLTAIDNLQKYCEDIEIDILCVIDWHFHPVYMTHPQQDFINTYDDIASNVLELASKTVKEKGFYVGELKKSWGSASEEIIKQTQKTHYDLIILGSHGKKGVKSWLGSVSRKIVNTAKEPVFISKELKENKKVLLTADGSYCSKYAIRKALSLFNFEDKELHIITVMEDISNLPIEITSNREWFNDYLKKRNCYAQNVIRETYCTLKDFNLNAKCDYSLIGAPSTTILETIEKEDIDLVILGSRSKDRISEFLLGSTSKRVLEHANCSVLIIAPVETEE